MCTVIVAWQCLPDAPLVVAANRDEMLARPSETPLLLSTDPPRWGGRDLVAGGTWLAVDPAGRIGAVTNRHPGGVYTPPDRTRSSRGTLPLDVLAGTDADARDLMTSLTPSTYNSVNVLYASTGAAYWTRIDDAGGAHTSSLTPGVHVLTEQDIDDPEDPKAARILAQAESALSEASGYVSLLSCLTTLLRSHVTADNGSPACIHGAEHGTVSSATVVVTDSRGVRYEHADGPPCVAQYGRVL